MASRRPTEFISGNKPVLPGECSEEVRQMTVLVVDDDRIMRRIIRSFLDVCEIKQVIVASSGEEAMKVLMDRRVDLVLTDLMMEQMSGFQLLKWIKKDEVLCEIPVIVMSGIEEHPAVVRCISNGAEDYLTKPLKHEMLWARVRASLERRLFRNRERALLKEVSRERERSENVLYNVMPRRIADRLRRGDQQISERVVNATVLFTDMVKFTNISSSIESQELVGLLNEMFMEMDRLVLNYDLEKIKTVGDSYMLAAGLVEGDHDHADRCVAFAKAAIGEMRRIDERHKVNVSIRVGIASGPLIAGVIGSVRPMYDVWGQTVNTASRMESHGEPERVQVAESTWCQLSDSEAFFMREAIEVKGLGMMNTYISKE